MTSKISELMVVDSRGVATVLDTTIVLGEVIECCDENLDQFGGGVLVGSRSKNINIYCLSFISI